MSEIFSLYFCLLPGRCSFFLVPLGRKTLTLNTRARLDEAVNTEIPRLEGLLASSEASLETTRTELVTAHEQISTLEADLAEIQQRLVDETDRLEGQVEEQKRLLSEGRKELDKERGEKRRVVGILAQTRASEAALKEEVER